ncbi:MAG: hypothetical protein D6708_06795 [Candidatus Dadabacteria bacterium]|nr:MAG: hypothetical protein D6708_06795 [Candidatus Dadabacteria bacterium]
MAESHEVRLQRLLKQGDRGGYAELVARVGPEWWFRMDLRTIDRHLAPLRAEGGMGLSPRLNLLAGAVAPPPVDRGLDRALRPLGPVYRLLHATRDWDGAVMAAGLALAGVWDFGTDFRAARPWRARLRDLVARPVSPAARAHGLAFLGLFQLFGDGDPGGALRTLEIQAEAAHDARCPEMVLYGSALRALTLLLSGRPDRAEVVLDDAAVHERTAAPGSHARAYFPMVRGVVECAAGRPEEALITLARANATLPEAEQPLSMRLQMASYRLLAETLARGKLPDRALEAPVRELGLAHHNRLHAAFLHFSLGTAYLRSGRAYRALVHADQGLEFARACGSRVPEFMNAVLRGQALSDLRETTEALEHLAHTEAEAERSGFGFFGRAARVERAHVELGRGNTDAARALFPDLAPLADGLWTPFRDSAFQSAFSRRLHPASGGGWVWGEPRRPAQIRTLGGFEMRMNERQVFDRRWGTGRTLALLKLIVALGGHKIPASELILELWPDADGDQGYANFKTALARLRKVADPGMAWIHLRMGRVSLSQTAVAVDALAFEQAAQAARRSEEPEQLLRAVELYRGDFLPLDDGWGVFVRRRRELRGLYVRVADALARACAAGRSALDPTDLLARACAFVPDAERLYARRMELFLARGFPAEALRVYREAEAALRETLGVSPGPELARLRERIR